MNCLVRWHYIEMAKLIAFLVFVCFEFSRQEEIAAVEKFKDTLLEELAFPEQQIIQETYPLDINLGNEKDYLKSTERAEPFSQQIQNSWETDPYDQMWEDYIEVTLDIEDWMMKTNPSMGLYKWLKVLEEGSMAKGVVPKCSVEVVSIFDYNDQNSWLNSEDNNGKLLEKYDKLVSVIEEWMMKANPNMSQYKWLQVLEKGTAASCEDYNSSSYDYYYNYDDNDIETFKGERESYKKRLPASRKLKFKRFTSV